MPDDHPLLDGRTSDSDLIRAARREPVGRTPVWFMRQAGRSLPEYRALREGVSMLTACNDPDLIAEITLQPVRRHGVDAAIFFSDIVVPVRAAGVALDIVPGVGPVVESPVRDEAGLAQIGELDVAAVAGPLAGARQLVAELGPVPLIGFAGAPFTLASYLVEGGPSRDLARTKSMIFGAPELWHSLADRLARIAGAFLAAQVAAGASAVQLFDSWVGALSERDYREYVLPHSRTALSYVPDGVPRIHFGVGSGELLSAMSDAGVDVMGVDFRVPLPEAARRVGPGFALQGNLDPAVLFAGSAAVQQRVAQVLDDAQELPGHIFNLGHGVLPTTDPAVLTAVVEQVHAATMTSIGVGGR
ncbi:MAG: uroporphyrinogen decarboxylase [Candidatus Nanopelagicales bacterium]